MEDFLNEDFDKLTQLGTVGILTRTNGQALLISSVLKSRGIESTLQRPNDGKSCLDGWVYRLFESWKNKRISEQEFYSQLNCLYPHLSENKKQKCWSTVVAGLKESANYEVSDLISNIINPKGKDDDNILFSPLDEKATKIIVSDVYRAKGKEFDSVLLQDELFRNDPKNDYLKIDFDEYKVIYVAVAQPKKELACIISKLQKNDTYIYMSRDDDRRCFKIGITRRGKYLSDFEVGPIEDLDVASFSYSEANQNSIANLHSGEAVMLEIDYQYIEEHPDMPGRYRIMKDENICLGYTSPYFWQKLTDAILRIYKNPMYNIQTSNYPSGFTDLYINRIITCVSDSTEGITAYKKIGKYAMWLGFEITGFGKSIKKRF